MKIFILAIVFLIILALKIWFSSRKIVSLKYFFTPLTTFILVLIALTGLYLHSSYYVFLICMGMILSLIGDVFNMMESPEYKFIQLAGFYFVAAHAFYITAFLNGYSFKMNHLIYIFVIILLNIAAFFSFIVKIENINNRINIAVYSLVVTISMMSAVYYFFEYGGVRGKLIASGMTMFWISDLILGVHVFVKKIKFEQLLVWGLYGPAQLLIAISCFYK